MCPTRQVWLTKDMLHLPGILLERNNAYELQSVCSFGIGGYWDISQGHETVKQEPSSCGADGDQMPPGRTTVSTRDVRREAEWVRLLWPYECSNVGKRSGRSLVYLWREGGDGIGSSTRSLKRTHMGEIGAAVGSDDR
jgi:hypothetical protein